MSTPRLTSAIRIDLQKQIVPGRYSINFEATAVSSKLESVPNSQADEMIASRRAEAPMTKHPSLTPKSRGSHDQTPFSHRQEEVAEGNAAIVAKCYVCGDPKHKFTACPFMIKAKQLASANAVTASDGDDSDATDNDIGDGADICMAVAATQQENETAEWLLDSGATHHLCGNRELIAGLEPAYLPIRIANGAVIEATAKGSCVVTTSVNGIVKPNLLTNVYFAEGLQRNLVSVKQLRKADLTVIFGDNCTIRDSNDNIVATAAEKRDLWCLSSPHMGSANFV
ncbi:hypothetical protein PR003_g5889 [Phytophthora rubi]|uniref:Retrovirus-related Pol polyprotein from transposon TNT 1-94-like beta-barrel domain-containing protein n=1 Tax=Phytophthora rubi TaxID=129364 RepID=A0A6A3MU44_9STRA|nr:hypothetical protein PR001_g10482 [Phytophthora rubi]KAE9349457.1 hypothetical protein PR003_g5889 [Phytophthora rubi]